MVIAIQYIVTFIELILYVGVLNPLHVLIHLFPIKFLCWALYIVIILILNYLPHCIIINHFLHMKATRSRWDFVV